MNVDGRFARYDHIIVHCSATNDTQDIGSVDIDNWHRQRGWRGCGYHLVIRRDGTTEHFDLGFPARPFGEPGAHVGDCGPNWNSRSLGFCLVGGVDVQGRPASNFTQKQMDALRMMTYMICDAYRKENIPAPTVLGHRDLIRQTGAPAKACPCFDVPTWWNLGVSKWPAIPDDEDVINTSETLTLKSVWEVMDGDTLWSISLATGVPVSKLRHLNSFVATTDVIFPGDRIILR